MESSSLVATQSMATSPMGSTFASTTSTFQEMLSPEDTRHQVGQTSPDSNVPLE